MTEREAFEAAAYALYQSKRAAGTPMVDDLPEGTTPEGLFWKQEDGSYGVLMFNAAWWGWQQGRAQRQADADRPVDPFGLIAAFGELRMQDDSVRDIGELRHWATRAFHALSAKSAAPTLPDTRFDERRVSDWHSRVRPVLDAG